MGTLTVQTLQAPTSGANANTILVPSGQTVHAAGSVVQVQQTYVAATSVITISSASLTASGIQRTITPKFSDSIIWVRLNIPMQDGITAPSVFGKMYVNGSAMTGAGDYHLGYSNPSLARYVPFTFDAQYQVTSTSQLTFEPYFRGGDATTFRVAHNDSSYCLTCMEIAQ